MTLPDNAADQTGVPENVREALPVPRFDCGKGSAQYCYGCYQMEREDEYGAYVRSEDYDALLADREALRARVAELGAIADSCADRLGDAWSQLSAAQAEASRLREALTQARDLRPGRGDGAVMDYISDLHEMLCTALAATTKEGGT